MGIQGWTGAVQRCGNYQKRGRKAARIIFPSLRKGLVSRQELLDSYNSTRARKSSSSAAIACSTAWAGSGASGSGEGGGASGAGPGAGAKFPLGPSSGGSTNRYSSALTGPGQTAGLRATSRESSQPSICQPLPASGGAMSVETCRISRLHQRASAVIPSASNDGEYCNIRFSCRSNGSHLQI